MNNAYQSVASSNIKLSLQVQNSSQRIWNLGTSLVQHQRLVVQSRSQGMRSWGVDGSVIRIYQGPTVLPNVATHRVSSHLDYIFSSGQLANVNSATNKVKSKALIIGSLTYDKLAAAYPTLDSYASNNTYIWQIEQKNTIGHPQSVLDLYNTNYVAKAVLDDGAVFYDPMINGDVSNYISEYYSWLSPYEYTRWNKGLSGLNRTGINGYTPYEREYPVYGNRVDLSSLNPADGITMEFFIRPKESFGDVYWGSVNNYTHYIWDEPRAYVNEQIGLRPVNTTLTHLGISSNVLTIRTAERHKMHVNDVVSTSTMYVGDKSVTNYSRTSGYDVYTVGSHSFQVGDSVYPSVTSPNYIGDPYARTRTVAKVSGTTISVVPWEEWGQTNYARMTYTWANNVISFTSPSWIWIGWSGQVWIDFESGGATADGVFNITDLGWGSYSIPYAGSGTGGTLTCVTYKANITGGSVTGTMVRSIPAHVDKTIASIPDDYTMTVASNSDDSAATNSWTYGVASGSNPSSVIMASKPELNPNPQYGTIIIHNNMPVTWEIIGTTNINDGQWHHVAITHESPSEYPDHPEWASEMAVISLWVDGEMQGRVAGAWDYIPLRDIRFPYGSYGFALGSGNRAWGNSAVAHLAWYGRALKDREIKHHASFTSVPPSFSGGNMVFGGTKWIQELV
jgi:hypothetical protein